MGFTGDSNIGADLCGIVSNGNPLHMHVQASPAYRAMISAALALFMGVLLSAVGMICLTATDSWWVTIALILGCAGAAGVLARLRRQGRFHQGYIPFILAAAGVGMVLLSLDDARFPVSGGLCIATAGFDLVKRGWEAPLTAQAIWSRIKALSLFFSAFFVFIGLRVLLAPAPAGAPVGAAWEPSVGNVPAIPPPAATHPPEGPSFPSATPPQEYPEPASGHVYPVDSAAAPAAADSLPLDDDFVSEP